MKCIKEVKIVLRFKYYNEFRIAEKCNSKEYI